MAKKNLEDATTTEMQEFLDSFDVVLCDCDGVLWNEREIFSGVKETLSVLSVLGKSIKFVSNNTLHTLNNFQKKICSVYRVTMQDVITPTLAIIDYLRQNDMVKKIYVLGSSQMRQEFVNAGFDVGKNYHTTVEENFFGLTHILEDCSDDVGAVISDFDLNMNYADIMKAGVYLQRPGVLFITGATETSVLINGKLVIGPGYFKNILEDLTGRKSKSFGKPDVELNTYLKSRFNIKDPSRTLFIGDTLEQDMSFASRCGYKKLLVLTGKTNVDDLTLLSKSELCPDYYISALGSLHKLISLIEL